MPKKTQGTETNDANSTRGNQAPPPLSEERIARLQAAVDAAQRKRMSRHQPEPDPEQGE